MKIAVIGGKGGTGKTLFSLILFVLNKNFLLVDTDVECPNLKYVLRERLKRREKVYWRVAEIDWEKCRKCLKCVKNCRFNAIVILEKPKVVEELCEGCLVCKEVCPFNAIKEKKIEIGEIEYFENLVSGTSSLERTEHSLFIFEVIRRARKIKRNLIIDCPAGLHCNVLPQIIEAEKVYIVTEPTPLGMKALIRSIILCKKLEKEFSVVLNKVGIGNEEKIERICKKLGAEIEFKIKYSKKVEEAYSNGRILELLKDRIDELLL